MVLCLIFCCGHRTNRDKGRTFSIIPKVVKNQGEGAQKLSDLRRKLWICTIGRADLASVFRDGRVCGKNLTSGRVLGQI